jgi:hypothetical protein
MAALPILLSSLLLVAPLVLLIPPPDSPLVVLISSPSFVTALEGLSPEAVAAPPKLLLVLVVSKLPPNMPPAELLRRVKSLNRFSSV